MSGYEYIYIFSRINLGIVDEHIHRLDNFLRGFLSESESLGSVLEDLLHFLHVLSVLGDDFLPLFGLRGVQLQSVLGF